MGTLIRRVKPGDDAGGYNACSAEKKDTISTFSKGDKAVVR